MPQVHSIHINTFQNDSMVFPSCTRWTPLVYIGHLCHSQTYLYEHWVWDRRGEFWFVTLNGEKAKSQPTRSGGLWHNVKGMADSSSQLLQQASWS